MSSGKCRAKAIVTHSRYGIYLRRDIGLGLKRERTGLASGSSGLGLRHRNYSSQDIEATLGEMRRLWLAIVDAAERSLGVVVTS